MKQILSCKSKHAYLMQFHTRHSGLNTSPSLILVRPWIKRVIPNSIKRFFWIVDYYCCLCWLCWVFFSFSIYFVWITSDHSWDIVNKASGWWQQDRWTILCINNMSTMHSIQICDSKVNKKIFSLVLLSGSTIEWMINSLFYQSHSLF